MVNVVSINLGNAGSTGGIARNIKKYGNNVGICVYTAYPASKSVKPREENDIIIGHDFFRRVSRKLAVYTGLNGCFSVFSTILFLKELNKISPDIIHLHNLHHSYVNLPLLFRYIKKNNIKVVWTLHDCWAFTGQCAHFTMSQCYKWKTGCHDCRQCHIYPEAKVDKTRLMWKKKRQWFTKVNNLQIVTPSRWLESLVKESFLKEYPVTVINNGIDTTVFTKKLSEFKKKYDCENKHIILGIAFGWGYKKGYDVFLKLADELPNEYQIVIVGNVGDLERKDNIIYINRTHDQAELVELYSASEVFVNPTREEVFGLVNVEAQACGVPVITFNTGGSPETISEKTGIVIENENFDKLKEEIIRVVTEHPFCVTDCIEQANQMSVDNMVSRYIKLYSSILGGE